MNALRKHQLQRRKRSQISVPTTSMCDIAFLLIIFFILCSNFSKQSGVSIDLATAPNLKELEESAVSVTIDKEKNIYLQSVRVRDAQAIEVGVAELLKTTQTDKERIVLFRCDKAVPREVFQPVIESIARAGGLIAAVGDLPSKPAPNHKKHE